MTKRMVLDKINCGRILAISLLFCLFNWQQLNAQSVSGDFGKRLASRAERGAMEVQVSDENDVWSIDGKLQHVTFNAKDLQIKVNTGRTIWAMKPAQPKDMIVKLAGKLIPVKLSDATTRQVTYYDAGYKTGIKIKLAGWQDLDLALYLTICLESDHEDLVFSVAAAENRAKVFQLNWPTALDASRVDYTLLSNVRGVLLPGNWPRPYFPIRTSEPDGSITKTDYSELQSNVIEDWSMSWWGFQKAKDAMMVIVETPNDAAYQFAHPAGGPTVIGPRWRASLGSLRYPRSVRMCFLPSANYVAMAKRYRLYTKETGLFVSLKDKVARKPLVGKLIGTPLIRASVLTNYSPEGKRWLRDPKTRHNITSFDQWGDKLSNWKHQGLAHLMVILTGWQHLGYDRQHPDALPPAPAAGGWEGMRRLDERIKNIGYLYGLHDQYRDYYTDGPSFDTQFAIHEEDDTSRPKIFPGTRFGDSKEGRIPYMDYWDGGKMTYLSGRFMLGHMKKNYTGLFKHHIQPEASYLDVFGYVPPDEDFNPEHPSTRTRSLKDRTTLYLWAKEHLGIVGTETACDWTVPFVDFSSPLAAKNGITVPLWDLVYHDAILTTYAPDDLHGLLNAGLPQVRTDFRPHPKNLKLIKRMSALNKRLAFVEMTGHTFLSPDYKKERTSYADGTTVTVDWNKHSVEINPPLP